MDNKERLKRFENLLEEIISANEDFPVLVEGKRDERALRNLGLTGEIVHVHRGLSLLDLCEGLAKGHDEVILMLDWDRKGRELTDKIRRNLITLSVRVNDGLMARLFSLVKKETKEVEDIDKLYERLTRSSKKYRLDKLDRATGFAEKRGKHP